MWVERNPRPAKRAQWFSFALREAGVTRVSVGSNADLRRRRFDVGFSLNNGPSTTQRSRQLCANNGLMHCSIAIPSPRRREGRSAFKADQLGRFAMDCKVELPAGSNRRRTASSHLRGPGSDVFALPAGRHGRTKDGPPLCPQEGAHDSSSRNFLRMRLNATGFSIIEK
jgi:hypothetical protein